MGLTNAPDMAAALTPARELDVLDHITRLRSGEPKGPGWRVTIALGEDAFERHFSDRGEPTVALADAVAWRDETVTRLNMTSGRAASDRGGRGLGVRITTTTTEGRAYRVAAGSLPAAAGLPKTRCVRSVDKYGYEGALREVCAYRFEGMKARYGDDYEFDSVEGLLRAVLAAEGLPSD